MKSSRPNILMVMADQLSAQYLGAYGHPLVKTPNIDALAAKGTIFRNAYCNSPICAPSRASLATGLHVSRLGAFDNGSDFPAGVPTFMHHLRRANYEVALSGKAHFIGPDQMHGFEQRLTPEIYPPGFDWTPDWTQGAVHNKGTAVDQIRESGLCEWSMQLDYDEEVQFRSLEYLRGYARRKDDGRPFFLCSSFTHPHEPFIINQPWWDLYDHDEIDMPKAAGMPIEEMHPYNQWLQIHHMVDVFPIEDEHVRNARHAYYGAISYFDSKIGELTKELERLGLADDTIIIVTSDHGEMLGEQGMWFKRTFFEPSIRVPLIVSGTDQVKADNEISRGVSLVDIMPTLLELGEVEDRREIEPALDGESLCPMLLGADERKNPGVISEYYSEGVTQPMRLAIHKQMKLVHVHDQPPMLFDLTHDPHERVNCANDPIYAPLLADLQAMVDKDWDGAEMRKRVMESQRRRRWILEAQKKHGKAPNWDQAPTLDPSRQYVRKKNAQATSEDQRYPRVKKQRRLPLDSD
jgi:choline-sulfatase